MGKQVVITEEELRNEIRKSIKKYSRRNDESLSYFNKSLLNGDLGEHIDKSNHTVEWKKREKEKLWNKNQKKVFNKFDESLECKRIHISLPTLNFHERIFFGDALEEETYPIQMRIPINEGECKTYPMKTTMRYVCSVCHIPNGFVFIGDGDGDMKEQYVIIYIPLFLDREDVRNNIDKVMRLCGWFLGRETYVKDDCERDYHLLQYEAKYPPQPNIFHSNGQCIYQVSPKKYMHKILKNGFCPSDKSTTFNYPSRNYFFKSKDTDFEHYANLFRFAKGNNEPYVLYTVDTRKIRDDIVFYNDDKLDGGIFTSENIPPSAIVNVKEIDLNSNN